MLYTLPDAPLHILGDIHGELEVLNALLYHLCYRRDGTQPHGRQLVFVGERMVDLIDIDLRYLSKPKDMNMVSCCPIA